MKTHPSIPIWTIAAPVAAWLLLGGAWLGLAGGVFATILVLALFAGVLAAVHHAEVVAHRVGEPFGTLVLAVAVTIIEVALIVSLMLAGGAETIALARDTVFAAVMIILNGIVGLCLLLGGARFREQSFDLNGVSTSLAPLAAIVMLTLVLPNYTTTVVGPSYSASQLLFIAIVSVVLYGTFVFVQTVRHRDFFLPPEAAGDQEVHATPPSTRIALLAMLLLLACLVAVVLLAKLLAPGIEAMVVKAGAPKALVGIIIAAVVLLPEGLAAVRAARANRLQTSLNLALGSALASIGLTIPAVALVALTGGLTLTLGIDAKSTVLLMLSLFVTMLSLGTGRTTVMQGTVLLVIFAVYLFTTIVP
jgi:Ca2+:H+ antiporter